MLKNAMKMLKNHKNWGGYMIFVGKSTYYMTLSGVGVVGPLKFSKIPLTDHVVQLKSLWTPPPEIGYIRGAHSKNAPVYSE